MKTLNVKFVLISSFFAASLVLLWPHIAFTTNKLADDTNFDVQAAEITKPDGVNR